MDYDFEFNYDDDEYDNDYEYITNNNITKNDNEETESKNNLIINKLHDTILQNIDNLFSIYLKKEIEDMKCFLINNIEFLKLIKHNNKYYFYLFVIYSKFKYNIKIHKIFSNIFLIKPNKIIYNKIKIHYSNYFDINNIENIFEKTISVFKGILLCLKILVKKKKEQIKKCLSIFDDGDIELEKIIKEFDDDVFFNTTEFQEIIDSCLFVILKIILLIIKNKFTDHKIELIINTSISIFLKCISHICLQHTKLSEIYFLVFHKNKNFIKIDKHRGLCYLFYYLDYIVFLKNRPKVAQFMKFLKNEYQKNNKN